MYGAENLRALLMIDGIVENNIAGTNDMAGPAYSLHNAERVEIIWGPVSALYAVIHLEVLLMSFQKKARTSMACKSDRVLEILIPRLKK